MLFEGLGNVVVISNAFVVATQLFAILAVLRLNWLKFASLAYDGLHIGIYVFGGLFFWPWIWNNVSILLAVRNNEDRQVGWHPKLCCIIVILLGLSLSLGASARLGWWDVTDIKIPMVQAQTDGGAWIDVPVSFFMSHSYAVSHGNFDRVATQGHYLPTRWGSAKEYERRLSSGTCPEPPVIDHSEAPKKRRRGSRV